MEVNTQGKGDGDGQVFCSLPRDLVWYHTILTITKNLELRPYYFFQLIQHMLYALKSNYFYAELLGIICSQNVI